MDFFDNLDFGGMDSSNTNFDYLAALQGLQGGGGADNGEMDFSNLQNMQNGGFGMNDRGLGTQDPNLGSNGTLSPGAIAGLGNLGTNTGNLANLGSQGSSGGNPLAQLGGLQGLLTLLAPLLGGVMSSNASQSAAHQQQQAAQQANDTAMQLMGGSSAAFKPYQDAGAAAMGNAAGMQWSPLSGRFADVQPGPALAPQYQNTAALLGPRFSSPGPGRMATLAGLGSGK